MKKLFYSVLLLVLVFSNPQSLSAQAKPAKLPLENRINFENFLKEIYTAYENKDYKALKNYYDRSAAEINPDGSMVQGIKNLEAAWKAFDGMVDEKPIFTYKLTSSRMVTPDVAIVTWDSDAQMKIKGQDMGGKAIGMAVLKKKNNSWTIHFDSMTPVMPMPPMPAPATPEATPSGN
ncbi:MAG: nuclear transport factor 2 family protein [Saprospiraceae bacterium]|nr:nuclear transport factor 2 family protein [Saprospiraceae bacterium]